MKQWNKWSERNIHFKLISFEKEIMNTRINEWLYVYWIHERDGIIPAGTTGETPTLSHEEHKKVIQTVINKVNKRVKVIAGTVSRT